SVPGRGRCADRYLAARALARVRDQRPPGCQLCARRVASRLAGTRTAERLSDRRPRRLGAELRRGLLRARRVVPRLSGRAEVTAAYPRDLIGYGAKPPHAHWPGGARLALQLVLNYEEGGENNVLHGDRASETFLSEIIGAQAFEPALDHLSADRRSHR